MQPVITPLIPILVISTLIPILIILYNIHIYLEFSNKPPFLVLDYKRFVNFKPIKELRIVKKFNRFIYYIVKTYYKWLYYIKSSKDVTLEDLNWSYITSITL
jgi:hypothetical protein